MIKLVLTESDLSTITNALVIARDSCSDAERFAEAPNMKEAFAQSTKRYGDLANKIEEADQITVEL